MPGWWIFLILFFNPTSIWHGLCIYMESYIRIIYEYISAFSCTFELTNKPNINGGIQIAICHRIPSRRRPSFWMCRTFLSAMHPNETFNNNKKTEYIKIPIEWNMKQKRKELIHTEIGSTTFFFTFIFGSCMNLLENIEHTRNGFYFDFHDWMNVTAEWCITDGEEK